MSSLDSGRRLLLRRRALRSRSVFWKPAEPRQVSESGPPIEDADAGPTPVFWERVEEVLDEVAAVGPDRLEAALAQACRGDLAIEAEVRGLLAHLPDPESLDLEADLGSADEFDPEELVGRDLGGFVVEAVIGRGGHGVVYRAVQERPRRAVALKLIEGPSLRFPRARNAMLARFEREVAALAAVDHPGVARILAAGVDGGTGRPLPFLVTEFVPDARNLVSWWRDTPEFDRRLATAHDVTTAVQAAHGVGILHRDLKPANLLVDRDGRAKVIDFGIAGVLDARRRVDDDLRGGSAGFASPEQLDAGGEVTVRSDVYAVGRVLAACLEIRPSWTSSEPRERRAVRDLAAVVARATAEDPDDRYETMAELGRDLRRVRDGLPAEASSAGPARRLHFAMRRNPGATAAIVAGVVTMLGMLVMTSVSWRAAVWAEGRLAADNDRLEAALEAEAASLYRERLTIASLAQDDPGTARRALEEIGGDHDDLAVRLLRRRFADDTAVLHRKGINAYRTHGLPSGRVVSGTSDRAVRVFDPGSAEPAVILEGLPEQVYAVAAADDGRSIVAGTAAGTLHHWTLDPESRVLFERVVLDDAGVVLAVAHHPSEPLAAIVGADGAIRLLDLESGADRRVARGVDTSWCDARFSPDGERLAVSGLRSGVVMLQRNPGGEWNEYVRCEADDSIRKVRFDPTGGRLAIAGGRSLVVLDAMALRPRLRAPASPSSIWSLAWSPTGDRVAIGTWGQDLIVHDAATLQPQRTLLAADGPIWSISWVREDMLATGEENAAIRWWPVADPEARSWHVESRVVGLVVDDHDDVVASNDQGGLFRLRCSGEIETLVPPLSTTCRSIVTEAGLTRIDGDRLQWFDLHGTLRSVATLESPVSKVDWIVPSPDGRWAGGVLDGHRIVVLEVATGRIAFEKVLESGLPTRGRWDDAGRFVLPLRWTDDESAIATELRIDPHDGTAGGPPIPVRRNIRTSTDFPGGWVAAMNTDDEFTVYPEGEGGSSIHVDQAHAGGVDHLVVADGGRTLVTGGGDGTVRLWTLPTADRLLAIPSRSRASVTALTVVDDRRVLVGHADGMVRRFDAVPAR